jgi:HEAT repeat protein
LPYTKNKFFGEIPMLRKRTITAILTITIFAVTTGFGQSLEENWNDFLHYTKIGRFDLAKGYAQAVLNSQPDPVDLLVLSEANRAGVAILQRVVDLAPDPELVDVTRKVLAIIEQGKFIRRSDPKIIIEEVKRLTGTDRGWFIAVKRLRNAGEYSIPFMLDAITDNSRKDEWENIKRALPEIGKDGIRPLVAALQSDDTALKADIIRALGGISYPQALGYLKYVMEQDPSAELRSLAAQSIRKIDPEALNVPAAPLFYRLAESYYYHAESLQPAEDADFANIWFWDIVGKRLLKEKVDRKYFNELMAMRVCEWALKADPAFGWAIGLWQAAYFKAESTGVDIPDYFGPGHADAMTYATTAGPEYLHQALGRAIKDRNAFVALGAIEALATIAGEKSLLFRIGTAQPLVIALSNNNKTVKYSAAIAIAAAGPVARFPESKLVVANLARALAEPSGNTELANKWVAEEYAVRAAKVMLKLGQTRNRVINLSLAQNAVINATKDSRSDIQMLAGQILAHLDSPEAQRAIAVMALDENNAMDVRISAFNSLAQSAKLNANLLDVTAIDAIYSLVSSTEADPNLRSAAARAYGSLNLPSQKVKDLILDQAKS